MCRDTRNLRNARLDNRPIYHILRESSSPDERIYVILEVYTVDSKMVMVSVIPTFIGIVYQPSKTKLYLLVVGSCRSMRGNISPRDIFMRV
ncbi:hypothetical protein C1H46_027314 [Malus baccata]|uniref:Uncharacterized protein n=1 Tax=Malus baccata TaxID=106549 RepID=A0A540LL44_MALBA|nr:hypothetical protein C1H46_027314 [Malus baccata]